MCGRYRIERDGVEYWRFFKGGRGQTGRWIEQPVNPADGPEVDPTIRLSLFDRPEIKPTEVVPIFRLEDGQVTLREASWWILPPWAGKRIVWARTKTTGRKYFRWKGPPGSHFNSKKSTLTELHSPDGRANTYWPSLLAKKRCVLPADGFIEWPDKEDAKERGVKPGPPRLYRLEGGAPFFFAGVWEEVKDDEGQPYLSANVITTDPNELLQALPHHRMPAMLTTPEEVWAYLEAADLAAAGDLLQPTPAERMEDGPWPPS